MTNEDTLVSFFLNIERIINVLLDIDEIVPDKEIMITYLLGLPPTWVHLLQDLRFGRKLPILKNYGLATVKKN